MLAPQGYERGLVIAPQGLELERRKNKGGIFVRDSPIYTTIDKKCHSDPAG